MYFLKDIDGFLSRILERQTVIAPRRKGDVIVYAPIAEVEDWLREGLPVRPLKEWFFPSSEHLFRFRGLSLQEIQEGNPFVVWGARLCDTSGLCMLDKVFNGAYTDPYYINRREQAIIIAIQCTEPLWGCFCEQMNIKEKGWDLLLTPLEEGFFLEVGSEKGETFLKELEFPLENGEGKLEEKEEVVRRFRECFHPPFDKGEVYEVLKENWEYPLWEDFARRCLGCGICTYLCPTCHCFDIQDENLTLFEGVRFRCWDSCQFAIFTKHASGHNPRPTKKERMRQRFMHKLVYCPDRYEEAFCTGCGRCVRHCPVNIDIREVLKAKANAPL